MVKMRNDGCDGEVARELESGQIGTDEGENVDRVVFPRLPCVEN